uniref:Oxidation resistance protein 1 n=1 Tax=Bursaphelenchus xylophilus TaxID=6326 RepID=A0A1I7RMQ6_BURXY
MRRNKKSYTVTPEITKVAVESKFGLNGILKPLVRKFARANSLKGTVQSGAQTVASGTQKVAHGVVTHTKSAADQIQTGIKTGANAVAEMPQNLVKVGSGLLHDGQNSLTEFFNGETPEMSATALKRERSIATLESLREKTKQVREQTAGALTEDLLQADFSPVLSPVEKSAQIVKDANAAITTNGPIGTPPDPPYYLTVRLDRRRKKKHRIQDESDAKALHQQLSIDYDQKGVNGFGNTRKREFWFAVPRARVDAIYHFLLQWSPDKYGQDVKEAVQQAQADQQKEFEKAGGDLEKKTKKKRSFENDRGFVVLDRDVEDYLTSEIPPILGGKPTNQPFGPHHNINREWEIVTVRELCRRLSLDDDVEEGEMPLPQGSTDSQILDEFMINQIMDILPPRAEGYPWVMIYSSEKHGFSLATLYRRMQEWKEEMSPVLLLIRDVEGHVFGAVGSTALTPQDHYYGTGDSSLLFRFTGEYPHTRELRSYTWTGDNQFFINASKDFLSMGAGGGHYGLYLDADLFNGRSQRCATFNNEPLAGGIKEDFQIQFIEAFGFSMDC